MSSDAKYQLLNTAIIVGGVTVLAGAAIVVGYEVYTWARGYIDDITGQDNPPGSTGLFQNAGPLTNGAAALVEAPFKFLYNLGGTVDADIVEFFGGDSTDQSPLSDSDITAYGQAIQANKQANSGQ